MPVLLDEAPGAALTVGLVNNMPDGALQATERQFLGLLARAAGEHVVRVRRYALPGVPRGEAAAAYLRDTHAGLDALERDAPDALIVTGCEPRAATLRHEPYWPALARLADWASRHTTSTLWSCLAAHAAVLHLDGVERRPLAAKRSGVFDCVPQVFHPLLRDVPARLTMAHSRWNDLDGADLTANGYAVLTASAEAGANLFAKRVAGSFFVFVQGHPEYDPDSLAREYRRDLARYLRGERDSIPNLPRAYFDEVTTAALGAVATLAAADRTAIGLRDLPRVLALRPGLVEGWGDSTVPLVRTWLDIAAAGASPFRARSVPRLREPGRVDEATHGLTV